MDGNKRTRSQTTLDQFAFVNLANSPLKQARSALKHLPAPPPPQPAANVHLKRPPSPAKDAALLPERDPKRPRHGFRLLGPSDDQQTQPSLSAYRRAVSVPALSTTIPLLDLNNVPPSPRRSPAKFRIASVPPEQPTSPSPKPIKSFALSIDTAPKSPPPDPHPPSPLSPLTPLPQHDDGPMPVDAAPLPSTSTSTSDSKPSKLPMPSLISKMKPKRPEPSKKARSTRPSKPGQPPPAVRTTRSTALRQKKVEDEARAKANAAGPSATPGHPRRSISLSYAQPTAASTAKASPVKPPSSRLSTAAPFSSAFTFTSTITPRPSHIGPFTGAGPSRIAQPQHDARPQHSKSTAQDTVPNGQQVQFNSSLSTLNQALERLNAPVPARPNTSMGFHREQSITTDSGDDDRAALRSSTGSSRPANESERARPGTALGMAASGPGANGKGKASLVSATPTPATKAAPGQPQDKRVLKQTTLMLPPPTPAPDKAKARASASASSASGTGGSGAATGAVKDGHSGEDAKKRQVNLALAPSLSKMRNSLGYALPTPGASSGPSSSTRPAPSTTAGTTTATQPKRNIPTQTPSSRALFGEGAPSTVATAATGESRIARPVAAPRTKMGTGLRTPATGAWRATSNRVFQRVSKKSSLPVVIGSPVKGGGAAGVTQEQEDAMDVGEASAQEAQAARDVDAGGGEPTTKDKIDRWLKNASSDLLRDLGHDGNLTEREPAPSSESLPGSSDAPPGQAGAPSSPPTQDGAEAEADESGGKTENEREKDWRRNASRRASMASQLLTQSLSSMPETPSKEAKNALANGKGKARTVSSAWPPSRPTRAAGEAGKGDEEAAAEQQQDGGEGKGRGKEGEKESEMPPPPFPPLRTRVHNTRLATGALTATPPNAGSSAAAGQAGGGSGSGKGKGKEREAESPGQLAVLRGCTIFVDVRTEEGDDAGALFVDMLRGLGAKMASRVGSRCTHVVYKNGLMSTLTRYRLLKDPKPLVVGIAWVVECAEQRTRVDEARFLVNLELANVAGVNHKRRRSAMPKFLSSPGSDVKTAGGGGAGASPAGSSDSSFTNALGGFGGASRYARASTVDRSMEVSSPTTVAVDDDGDSSMQSSSVGQSAAVVSPADAEESLPPLEKARRRRSMLPAATR